MPDALAMASGLLTTTVQKNNDNYDNHLKLYLFFFIKAEYISSPANNISQLNDLCGNGPKLNIHQCKSQTCNLKVETFPAFILCL